PRRPARPERDPGRWRVRRPDPRGRRARRGRGEHLRLLRLRPCGDLGRAQGSTGDDRRPPRGSIRRPAHRGDPATCHGDRGRPRPRGQCRARRGPGGGPDRGRHRRDHRQCRGEHLHELPQSRGRHRHRLPGSPRARSLAFPGRSSRPHAPRPDDPARGACRVPPGGLRSPREPDGVPATTSGMPTASALVTALTEHPLLGLALTFAGGVATSLTPCLYPMIPITAAIVGEGTAVGPDARSRWRTVRLTAAYVLGLAMVYAGLGLLAGLTGTLFGGISTNPWAIATQGNLLLLFA